MSLSLAEVFAGRKWVALGWVSESGEIAPPAKVPCPDVLVVHNAFKAVGPGVYNVVNVSKGYAAFVQFKRGSEGQWYARCAHDNCEWQSRVQNPRPCKHLRAACRWHVKLNRRAKIRDAALERIREGGPCPNCPAENAGRLLRVEHRPDWTPGPEQRIYYEYWYRCNKCLSIHHVEQAKRDVESWRAMSA